MPRALLRLEGLAVLVAAVTLYADGGYGWLLLAVLFLAPDLSMIGYVAGPKVGALSYNVAHTTVGPIGLALAGVLGDADRAVQLALIWFAHIGADRMIGYGLKYPSAFKDTHLQRV